MPLVIPSSSPRRLFVPITVLDPGAALVVVDLQLATTSNSTVHPMADVVGRVAGLAAAFRRARFPVVLATARLDAPPAGRTQLGGNRPPVPAAALALVPDLDGQPSDLRAEHHGWSAFGGTTLADDLRARGVTQVILVGLATSFGVESTARDAYDAGFHVVVAVDATTDLTEEGYRHACERVFPVLGETTTTREVLAALAAT
jgi:nicotinamidase-related amidase